MSAVVVAMAGLLTWPGPGTASGAEPVRLPDASTLADVDFDRHVASLFGRLGCNAGSCHGSFQGRGGLFLSLFGHDPARDFRALTRDAQGRRINPLDPDRSLVLLKATGQVPHEGGRRFAPGSWEYQVIRAWIADGARRDPARPGVESIEVRPAELSLGRPGGRGRLAVVARFGDGTECDVTSFCDLRVRDDAVANADLSGQVLGLRPGSTAVVASYGGRIASGLVSVATGRTVEPREQGHDNLVDREVDARLHALGVEPSGPASDAEFLRRVTLDLIGTLPGPDDARAFLADTSAGKRHKKIDELLAHPMHAALWATRFMDITGCDVDAMEGPDDLRPRRARQWHDWFRKRFAENVPFDRVVRGVLVATSREGEDAPAWALGEAERVLALKKGDESRYEERPGLDLFWRRFNNGEIVATETFAERVAAAFLGVRIECAQCHKHPFDRWTQADYRGFANIFADVRYGLSPDGLAATASLLEDRRKSDPSGALPPIPRIREVFAAPTPSRRLRDPATGRTLPPKALGGPEFAVAPDPREAFADWLLSPDNPAFSRSFVNRVWGAYFGKGLVDPVDGFSVATPPSNPRLLDALAADFAVHGFDVRRLERLVLNSRAYQRSSEPNAGNREDRSGLAHAEPRVLMAEVLVDALNAALGVPGDFGPDAPKGGRAVQVATNRVASPDLARVFRVFGRPQRVSVCDCERPSAPTVPQTLFLMTDPALLARAREGRVRGLAKSDRSDADVVADLFLAALTRFPDAQEARAAAEHLRGAPDRTAALADLAWAIINTREFILNH